MSAIDSGTGQPIKNPSQQAATNEQDEKRTTENVNTASTWWFASTACPLLAATFGPIANGFSVCALGCAWRAYIPDGKADKDGKPINDPGWLLVVNAISLVSALVGNAALLLNMARRMKFSLAQPITIAGFLLAGILLIADMVALTVNPHDWIKQPDARAAKNHALTSAFYFAIFAAIIYIIIGLLMCFTVYGANKRYYPREFNLTPPQRTLMLQTMAFVMYLLICSLVFSRIEEWSYLDTVYWADVTLLTVGLGDMKPKSGYGRGLIIPFAIGGILMVGIVVGSIRSLVLERASEKMGARITEKRRANAVHDVDDRKQTIQVSWFAQADFSTDPSLSPAQRREEEFQVMRTVQAAAELERRYFALCTSLAFVAMVWLLGAMVFMLAEHAQRWSYFQAVYFTFIVLVTVGYGDYTPTSNAGKAFFVIWSLLAVPALTVLVSNLGDTLVKTVLDWSAWVGRMTVLPDEKGTRYALRQAWRGAVDWMAGFVNRPQHKHQPRQNRREHQLQMTERVSLRLEEHLAHAESRGALEAQDPVERDIHFYHYVLAREIQRVQQDLRTTPPVQYSWHDWEFFLQLIGGDAEEVFPGMDQADAPFSSGPFSSQLGPASEPEPPIAPKSTLDGAVDRVSSPAAGDKKRHFRKRPTADMLRDWSWMSDESPLLSSQTESEWVVQRLSETLVRELGMQPIGPHRRPPVGMRHVLRRTAGWEKGERKL